MRTTLILATLVLIFTACKKDKYTTEPQVKYKSVNPNLGNSNLTSITKELAPKLTIEVTDAEGDVGRTDTDTSWVFIKNLKTDRSDSFPFPDLQTAAGKKFKADVVVNLYELLLCIPTSPRPRRDTFYFEVYVNDFGKNKSNIISTGDPVYFDCL